MKFVLIFLIYFLISNCSLNTDSKYWTEDELKKDNNQTKLKKKIKKLDDITIMTFEEYEIYIDDNTKKSKYPDISK